MDWRPLGSHGGNVTDVKFDSDGRIIIRSRQNVDAILEHNKIARAHGKRGGDWRHYAHIPLNIVHKWMKEGLDILGGEQPELLARKLNDPDNAYLRIESGHIGVSNGVAR